ncbi:hypothetical protein [Candidatus Tisiphia endosymbiont of Parasteatoda lunata]|uniref:hypothetical protein n=1 Tax=Candidatus Tisiphia endosymbiont of Parasteatoda lunata TaxID=3066275 RepID=UPI00313CAA62
MFFLTSNSGYIKQWLIDNPGWLLVYDNVNNYREIEPFLPEAGGHVILTTRQRYWSTKFSILPVNIMTEEEAIKTIKTLTGVSHLAKNMLI